MIIEAKIPGAAKPIGDRLNGLLNAREDIAARLADLSKGVERRVLSRLAQALEGIDLNEIARQALPIREGHAFGMKYLSLAARASTAAEMVERLRLHRRDPIDILDLGAGAGFFCFAAAQFGHRVVALEPGAKPLDGRARVHFGVLLKLLGVPVTVQRIEAQTPLRCDDVLTQERRFDLITAFAIMFNRPKREPGAAVKAARRTAGAPFWRPDDYRAFMDDLRANWLKPGGRLVLRFSHPLYGTSERRAGADNRDLRHYAMLGDEMRPFLIRDLGDIGVLLDPARG
jgi:SAM-dependent methyltransferase